jgi:hypothetical protein
MSEFMERPPADPSLIGRMIRAAQLDPNLYAEVEADRKANGQAAAVVFLAAMAGGVGNPQAPFAVVAGAFIELAVWFLFACVVYYVGARLLPEAGTETDLWAVARALGFSHAPLLLQLLGVVAPLRGMVFFVAGMWSLVAMITAVRHALSYTSAWRAVGVCTIPLLGRLLIAAVVITMFSQTGEVPAGSEPPVELPW